MQDVRGNSFDALGRSTAKYEISLGSGGESIQQYDTSTSYYGLLAKSSVGAAGQFTSFTYDAAGRIKAKTYDSSLTPTETYTYDLDGRTTQIASSLFGPENYTYDADARLTEKDDPTPGTSIYADPGAIVYKYYADGTRRSVVLTVPALSISSVKELGYSYYADGHLRTESVFAGDGGSYGWTYTAAGRELTQSDPSTGQSVNVYDKTGSSFSVKTFAQKTTKYDSYGQLSSIEFPSNMWMSPFVFDAEGNVLSDMSFDKNVYTLRGELAAQSIGNLVGGTFPAKSLGNGTSCMDNCTFSATSGQMVTGTGGGEAALTYTNDLAGRTTRVVAYCAAGQYPEFDNTKNRQYDAENHTLMSSMVAPLHSVANGVTPPNSCDQVADNNIAFSWGNSGHPYVATVTGNGPAPLTTPPLGKTSYHWDGDQILYDGSNLYIGLLGVVPLTGTGGVLTFDRDYSGTQVQTHVVNQVSGVPVGHYTAYAPPGAMLQATGAKFGSIALYPDSLGGSAYIPVPAPPISPRGDGYMLGDIAIQGVRAYDPTSAQWTTPDAYSGDVDDPMSLKPFVYNNNNPIAFEDPSGYEGSGVGLQGLTPPGVNPMPEVTPDATYVKIEAVGFGGAAAITRLSNGHWYVAGGASASTPGASLMFGGIYTNKGQTPDDVAAKWSGAGGGGFIVGAEAGGNESGAFIGVGLTTPGGGGTMTYGRIISSGASTVKARSTSKPANAKPLKVEKKT
jgi:hypothetical protein